jgi:hypothetical protein
LKLAHFWKLRKIIDYSIIINIKDNEIIEIPSELFYFLKGLPESSNNINPEFNEIISDFLDEGILER